MSKLKFILLSLLLTVINYSYADDFTHEGIKYSTEGMSDGECKLVSAPNVKGSLVIPGTVINSQTKEKYNVTEIEKSAFSDNLNLQEVVIPNSILRIQDYAFSNCSNLEKLTLGNNVISIGMGAFKYTNLKRLGLPSSVLRIYQSAFEGNSNLEYVMLGKGLICIEESAFSKCTSIEEVEIEDLTSWCSVQLDSKTSNPIYFSHSFSIRGRVQTSLTIPSGIEEIKDYSFVGCTAIKALTLSENVNKIGERAFAESGLTKIEDTANVNVISDYAFYQCNNLKSVVLSEKVRTLGKYTFSECKSLNRVTVLGKLQWTGDCSFSGCESLSTIDVGKGLGNICVNAFDGCKALKNVIVSSISDWCKQLFPDNLSNPLYYSGNLIIDGTVITDLILDKDITRIPQRAFINCSSLQSVVIGNEIKSIGRSAFSGCSNISSLVMGANINSIEPEIFSGCISLRTISAFMSEPPLQLSRCFSDIAYSNATLYVIPDSYYKYRRSEPWSYFKEILEYEINIDEKSLGLISGKKVMNLGDRLTIDVNTVPTELKNQLIWTSSDPDVATVNDGVVQALKTGSTKITVSTIGVSKTIDISVIIPVKSINLNYNQAHLKVGEQLQLTAKLYPENATDRSIKWTSSDPYVISVSNGQIKAISPGSAIITATSSNGISAECHVTANIPATAIVIDRAYSDISNDILHMKSGERKELKVLTSPSNATERPKWTSNDESVVTVSDNVIEAHSGGSAVVTVQIENGRSDRFTVIVDFVELKSINLNYKQAQLKVGDQLQLIAKLTPENATEKSIVWTSSNPNIATVSDGQVTALSPGSTTIKATTSNGLTTQCNITVILPATSVVIERNSNGIIDDILHMEIGEKKELNFSIYPDNTTDKPVWTSSDESVLTIRDNIIEACSTGSAVVTVQIGNGKSDKITVIVYDNNLSITWDQELRCLTGVPMELTASTPNMSPIGYKLVRPNGGYVYDANIIEENGKSFVACNSTGVCMVEAYLVNHPETKIRRTFNIISHGKDMLYEDGIYYCYTDNSRSALKVVAGWEPYAGDFIIPTKAFGLDVVQIDAKAFYTTPALGEIILPEGLTEIGQEAFGNSSMHTIYIPASVNTIRDWVFNASYKIANIYLFSTIPVQITYKIFNVFSGYDKCILHIPYGTLNAYRNADIWKNFINIIDDIDVSGIKTIDADISNGSIKVYDLNGVYVSNTIECLSSGIYIIKNGTLTSKVVIK